MLVEAIVIDTKMTDEHTIVIITIVTIVIITIVIIAIITITIITIKDIKRDTLQLLLRIL